MLRLYLQKIIRIMAKSIANKYVWLVETIYNAGRITFDEISRKWEETDLSEGMPLALRTFHKWRQTAEEMFDVNIECERKGGYHYYIDNPEDLKKNNLRTWLLQTLSVSNLMMENQALKDRILPEEIPSGKEFLSVILNAMKNNHALEMAYKSFWHMQEYTIRVYPYCIKSFKQRWYMLANRGTLEEPVLRTYALDRIYSIQPLPDETFQLPEDFDAHAYFGNVYGIINTGNAPQTVRLKVSVGQANYIRSLPLHKTQKEVERTDEYSIFELWLCPELDFQQEILSKAPDIEVLEPVDLRNSLAEKVNTMNDIYKGKAI